MKYKQKLLGIISLIMLCLYIPVTSQAKGTYVEDDAELRLLQSLNILSVSEVNEDFSTAGVVTRGQFVAYVSRLMKNDNISKGKSYYIDVPDDHYACAAINVMTDIHVLSGYDDHMFHPDDYIQYAQAVKILTAALGYVSQAEAQGGYPEGYLSVARGLELTKGISLGYSDYLTKADAVKLMFNSLDVSFMEITGVKGNNLTYGANKDNSFLRIRDIYTYEGQVTEINNLSLTGNSSVTVGSVKIGDQHFYAGDTNIEKYIGQAVKIYYKKENDAFTVLFIEKTYSTVLELNAGEINEYSNNCYYYTLEGETKERKQKISADVDVIYNSRIPTGFNESYMTPEIGRITIVDNSDNEYSDVVMITAIKNCVASVIDTRNNIIYGKNGVNIDLNRVDYTIYNANGSELPFEMVKEWDVLSFAASDDGKYAVIYLSEEQVTGTIDTIKDEGNYYILKMGSSEYRSYDKKIELPGLGSDVTLYLDVYGNAAWAEEDISTKFPYGYLIKVYKDDNEETVTAKLLTASGHVERIPVSDRLKLNGASYKGYGTIYNMINNLPENVIRYKCTSEGKLQEIYGYDSKNVEYVHGMGKGRYKYNTKQQTFNGTITITDDLIVFIAPEDADSDNDYKVTDKTNYKNDKFYTIDCYTQGDTPFTEAIVMTASSMGYEQHLSVVKKVSTIIDEENEIRTKLDLLHNGMEVSYVLKDEKVLGSVDNGDVIRISLTTDNMIEDILHVYNHSNDVYLIDNPYIPETSNKYYSNQRIKYGNVYSIDKGLMQITMNDPGLPVSELELENCLADKFVIYRYDNSSKVVCTTAGYTDIISYMNSKTDYSRVIVSTNWGDPADIIIVN